MWAFGEKSKKVIFRGTYVFLFLFFLWQILLRPLIDEFMPMGPIRTDVAKRIESPDGTKTALLIRRNGWDLNFAVKIKENLRTKTLHWSRDFVPDLKADWNEQIVWSDDSSFIVLTVDDVQNSNEKYMWAYDFRSRKEYYDKDEIISILSSRSEKKKAVE